MRQAVARQNRLHQLTREPRRELTSTEYDDVVEAWNGTYGPRRKQRLAWCETHGHAYHRIPGGRRLVCVRCARYMDSGW